MKFFRFDPERCAFPPARLSPLPDRPELLRRSPRSPWPPGGGPVSAAGAGSRFRHFSRGRYALAEAYRLAGVGRDGALLAPAYHCVTMLDPALALGADVQLYPLGANLAPDQGQLDALLRRHEKPIRALLATHFFGFPQDFAVLTRWCDKHRIVLIEDCSHVLFTETFQAAGTGIFGRFVVASPYKFFPCADGGLLYSATPALLDGIKTAAASPMRELRGIKCMLEKTRSTGPSASDIDLIDRQLLALSAQRPVTGVEQIIERVQASAQYCAATAQMSSLRSSRLLVRHSSIARNIRRRRDNFQRWTQALGDLPNCRALYPDLPENCAPYMFPLYIECPTPHFYWLKHLGFPVWRWDQMAVSACPIAEDYRLHLIHLPCHQALSDVQMEWMIVAVQKTLRQAAPGAP